MTNEVPGTRRYDSIEVHLTPPSPDEIAIRCSEASHSDRVVQIAEFKPKGDGTWTVGRAVQPMPRTRPRNLADERGIINSNGRVDHLIDDAPWDPRTHDRDEQFRFMSEGRTRYSLECRLCGLSKTYREENLFNILDKLRLNGIKTIELRMLP